MKPLLIANWKMNPGSSMEARKLALSLARAPELKKASLVLCPPFLYLEELKDTRGRFALGAQDCFWEQKGAYTGEVSPLQLYAMGCRYVILGHSERKRELGETLAQIARKAQAALQASLIPVVCLGERKRGGLGHRELRSQAKAVLGRVSRQQASRLVAVYEPEWAISTAKGAKECSPFEISRAGNALRQELERRFGRAAAGKIPILYGGSVNAKNIAGILGEGGAAGALVGAASLRPREFLNLVKNAALG